MAISALQSGYLSTSQAAGEVSSLQRAQRRALVLLLIFVASACLIVACSSIRKQRDELLGGPSYSLPPGINWQANPWAAKALAGSADDAWLQTSSISALPPLPAYNPNDDSTQDRLAGPNEEDDEKEIDEDESSAQSLSYMHQTHSAETSIAASKSSRNTNSEYEMHKKRLNPDVQSLDALKDNILGQDSDKPAKELNRKPEKASNVLRSLQHSEKQILATHHDSMKNRNIQEIDYLKKGFKPNALERKDLLSDHPIEVVQNFRVPALDEPLAYSRGMIRRTEHELEALNSQEKHEEAVIRQTDGKNIAALKMEEEEAKKNMLRGLATIKRRESKMARELKAKIAQEETLAKVAAAKHVQHEKIKRLQAEMAKIKQKDDERIAALNSKLNIVYQQDANASARAPVDEDSSADHVVNATVSAVAKQQPVAVAAASRSKEELSNRGKTGDTASAKLQQLSETTAQLSQELSKMLSKATHKDETALSSGPGRQRAPVLVEKPKDTSDEGVLTEQDTDNGVDAKEEAEAAKKLANSVVDKMKLQKRQATLVGNANAQVESVVPSLSIRSIAM
jgi:hypothetical protein